MRDYTFTVPNNTSITHSVPESTFLRVKTAGAELRYRLQDKSGAEIASVVLSQGNRITVTREFTTVTAENSSGIAQTVNVTIGAGNIDDSNISGEVALSPALSLASGSASCAPAASSLILTPISGCREVFVSVPSSAVSALTIGDSGVTDGAGIIVPPGTTANIPTAASIYAYNPNTSSVTVGHCQVVN